jgi:hypothetical protein
MVSNHGSKPARLIIEDPEVMGPSITIRMIRFGEVWASAKARGAG